MKATPLINLKAIIALAIGLFSTTAFSQDFSAGINIDNPNPNAVLHLVSPGNNQGLLIPQLTTAQRTAMVLTAAENGLLVFDSDLNAFFFWANPTWIVVSNTDQQDLANVLTNGADAGGNIITNAGDPVNPQDVATRNYVDLNDDGITAVTSDGTLTGDGSGTPLGVNVGTGVGQILQFATANTLPALDGSALTGVSSVIAAGAITSTEIADGTIVDADVNAGAAIAGTKITPNFGAQNITTTGIITGTIDLNTVNSASIVDGTIANADVAAGAAIAGTKIDPNFGAQNITTTGTITGTLGANTVDATTITDGSIVDADVNAAAAIAGTKVTPNFGAQNIVTTGTITGTLGANTVDATTITDGSIVDADVNAAAAIAGTKVTPNFGAQNITTTGTITGTLGANTVDATTITDGSIIDADVNAAAAIAGTKVNPNFGAQNITTTGTITGTLGANTVDATTITDGSIVDADVNAAAAIAGSKINPNFGAQNIVTTGTVSGDGSLLTNLDIADADVNATAAIAGTKIDPNFGAQNITTTGTITGTLGANTVDATSITDGSIVDADVNAAAAIAGSKINPNFGAQNISTTGTISGDGSLLTNLDIVDADVNASAAIAGSKINPNFGAQNISTTGTIAGDGSLLTNLDIVDADVNASAAIAGSKINPDFAAQTIQTTGALSIGGITNLDGNIDLGTDVADLVDINGDVNFFGEVLGANPFIFQGFTDNVNTTTLNITDPSGLNTIIFPDASGTVLLGSGVLTSNLALMTNASGQIVSANDAETFGINSNTINIGNAVGDATTVTGDFTIANGLTTTNINNDAINIGDAASDAIDVTGNVDFNGGNFTIADGAGITNINNTTINLGNAAADNVNMIGTLSVDNDIVFNETTNNLTLQVQDQSTGPSTLIFPNLNGTTEAVVTSGIIDNPFTENLVAGINAGNTLTATGQRNVMVGQSAGAIVDNGSDNVLVGRNAGITLAGGSNNVLVGSAANTSATSQNVVGIGSGASAPGDGSIAIGQGAQTNNPDAIAIGRGSIVSANGAIAIGDGITAALPNSIILGNTADGYRVGIGVETPGVTLDIAGTDAIRVPVGTNVQQPAGAVGMIRYNTDINDFEGYVNTAWRTLSPWTGSPDISYNGGLVGIGTATPDTELHIYSTADITRGITIDAQGTLGNQTSGIAFTTLGDGATPLTAAGTNGWLIEGYGDAYTASPNLQNDLTFTHYNGAAISPAILHLDPIGNVGIGTDDPQASLQIGATLGLTHFLNTTGTPQVIDGDVLAHNLYVDYNNPTDNELFRATGDSASFIFQDRGQINFMSVVNGSTVVPVDLDTEIFTWMELKKDGNADFGGGVEFGQVDGGEEQDGMVRFDEGGTFRLQAYQAGSWQDLVGLPLPYSSGPQSIGPSLLDLENDNGPAASFVHSLDGVALDIGGDVVLLDGANRHLSINPNLASGDSLFIAAGDGLAGSGGDVVLFGGLGTGGPHGNVALIPGWDGVEGDGAVLLGGPTRIGHQDPGVPGILQIENPDGTQAIDIVAHGSTTDHVLTLPPVSAAGALRNDGGGNLTWSSSIFAADFYDDADNVIFGSTSPVLTVPVTDFQLGAIASDAGGGQAQLTASSYGAGSQVTLLGANGEFATPTNLISGNVIGDVNFVGYDGTYNTTALVRTFATGLWDGLGDRGSALTFWATPNGTGGHVEMVRVEDHALSVVNENNQARVDAISAGGASSQLNMTTSRGTIGTPGILQLGDIIGELSFIGYEGVGTYVPGARISAVTTENWGTANNGTALVVEAATTADDVLEEIMRIEGDNVAMGWRAFVGAGGARSIAIGSGTSNFLGAESNSLRGIAIGYDAEIQNSSNDAIAFGSNSRVNINASESIAIGLNATTGDGINGTRAIAIGPSTDAIHTDAMAIGFQAQARDQRSLALGFNSQTAIGAQDVIALGVASQGNATGGTAIGAGSRSDANDGLAVGSSSRVNGADGIAIGRQALSDASRAIAIGAEVTANTANTIVLGDTDTPYNVGIGITSPAQLLDVAGLFTVNNVGGTVQAGSHVSIPDNSAPIINSSGMTVVPSGRVMRINGIGGTSSISLLDPTGIQYGHELIIVSVSGASFFFAESGTGAGGRMLLNGGPVNFQMWGGNTLHLVYTQDPIGDGNDYWVEIGRSAWN